jgi:serine/threonine protein kinase
MQNTHPIGTILRNQYLVQELLSKGAFSAVYLVNSVKLVEDPRGKRYISTRFALKEVVIPSRNLRHHINIETIALIGIDHEGLPHIYDVFNISKYNRLYILMDNIEGPDLEKVRLQQPGRHLPLAQVMTIMAPILGAVSYLHSQQPSIIHQNIEPTSIMISQADNKPVLVDFGVGKQYNLSSQDVTVRGPMIGYEAPEQYGGEICTRTDIYGLGATLYTLLTGIVPADALHRKRLIESENIDPLKPVNHLIPAIPEHVAEAIQRAMSLDSNDRFPTVEQFAQVLRAESVQRPPDPITLDSARQDQQAPPPHVEPAFAEEQKPVIPIGEQAVTPPSPDLPGRIAKTPTPQPVTVPLRAPTTRKRAALLLIALALIVSIDIGTGLLLFAKGHHNSTLAMPTVAALHETALPTTPASTEASTPSSIVALVESYNGTIFDLSLNMTTEMSLTQIQQSSGNISGYFTGLYKNGLFKGSVNAAKHIQFLVIGSTGLAIISFDGGVQFDGHIAGSFCSLNPAEQCDGTYGVWSAAPA